MLEQFQGDAASNCEKASRGEIKDWVGLIKVFLCNGEVSRERSKAETSLKGAMTGLLAEEKVCGVRWGKCRGSGSKLEDESESDSPRGGEAKECKDEEWVDRGGKAKDTT